MGASLDTPARCPLCNELTRDPVTLKCKHQFCQRCIGDLWSVTPNGPYHCPEWKCKTVYQTLPFDSSLIRPPAPSRRPQPRSSAGTSSSDEQNAFDAALRRPSLTSRLLGKRKASTPVSEQPHTKRSTVESPNARSSDAETSTTSLSDQPGQSTHVETSKKAAQPESTESYRGDGASSSEHFDSKVAPATDGLQDTPVQLNQHKSEHVISLDDSDSSIEVDICDTPPLATPKKDTQKTGIHVSPTKPVSSANSDRLPGKDAPVNAVSKPPLIFTRSPVAASGSPSPQPATDGLQDTPVQLNQHKSEHLISLDDSDSSIEVDICDAPPLATPKKDPQKTGIHVSPTKPVSSANSDRLPRKDAPVNAVSKPPLIFTKSPVAASGSPSRVGPVPCHYCPKIGCQSAVKTCLVCGASMCKEHLRPHLESPVFQNHTLVSPTEDISLWRCQEHQEINRIYCRHCGVCVCTVCTIIGSHRDHVCISIREAERELRGNLKEEIRQLQEAEQQVKNRVTELTEKKKTFTVVLREARAGVKQQYGAIREALEQEEQSALQCVTKEENRVLGGLEENLCHLRTSLQALQHGLHSLEGLADAKGDKRVQDQAFIMEYSKVSQLASDTGSYVEQFEAPEEVDRARLKCLQSWTEKRLDTVVITMPGKDRDLYRLLYGTSPSLDADTAHLKLQLSDNNRRVTYSDAQQVYTEHDARFSSFPQVLASCALEGGRWYWEVNVSVDEGRWKVGLCEGQIERKGQKDSSRLGFNTYSWCLSCDKRKVEALHNKVSTPVNADGLQRVGVFLDFEEGVLSFFNVTPGGSLALMHSYKHRFTDPLYPALSVSKTHLAICDLFQS